MAQGQVSMSGAN
jgi:hypothetical protein